MTNQSILQATRLCLGGYSRLPGRRAYDAGRDRSRDRDVRPGAGEPHRHVAGLERLTDDVGQVEA
jgi:hypothetical protein